MQPRMGGQLLDDLSGPRDVCQPAAHLLFEADNCYADQVVRHVEPSNQSFVFIPGGALHDGEQIRVKNEHAHPRVYAGAATDGTLARGGRSRRIPDRP